MATGLASKRVSFGGAGLSFTVTMDARRAARLRQSLPYRKFVRPALGVLGRRAPAPPLPSATMVPQPPALDPELLPAGSDDTPAARALWRRVCAVGGWYHTIALGHGIVTPGAFDHRAILERCGLPRAMDGLRALDVATFDGYWAFEMERRGAREVVALDLERYSDLDLLPSDREAMIREGRDGVFGTGFALAHEALGSRVRRVTLNVYDLAPDRVGGTFDVVYCGDLLLHLMNVPKALQAIRSVTGGEAIFVDEFAPDLDALTPYPVTRYLGGHINCTWWMPSRGCLVQMIKDAGYRTVQEIDSFVVSGPGKPPAPHVVIRGRP